ncbi:MAG TPA: hypothetical protein DEF04_13570 [Clostridiales bacterium]|nr:hypothetical protein [Clostridiales bacterium]
MDDLSEISGEQIVKEELLKQPDTSRTFLSIYLSWMLLTYIFIILGYSKFGLAAIIMPMLVIPIFAVVQKVLYKPQKSLYLLCLSSTVNNSSRILRIILLCIVFVTPIIYYGFMAYSPGCGIPEMKRMVAEGTAYFEQHREELYAEVENISIDDENDERIYFSADWNGRSGQTFGGLYYDSHGVCYNTSLGYPMEYPLDEYWCLSFIDGYN